MTVEKLIAELSLYPSNLDLSEIEVTLSVEKECRVNRIWSAYLADHRIAGNHPWGRLQHMERQTNLAEVAESLLTGLKLRKQ